MNIAVRDDQSPLECVAFMLLDHDRLLVERRSPKRRVVPGVLSIPGGHMDVGESPEDALARELAEELGVSATSVRYICTLLHRSEEFRKLHYFAIDAWIGDITPTEAESLQWIGLGEEHRLDLDVDRQAIREYCRVYR